MLTAWDTGRGTMLALPDFEDATALSQVRDYTRRGELVCPTCRQPLWVRAGEIRMHHFAHRTLSDCPHGKASEAVLSARRLLYRFFQARIESGRLLAEIVLEPVIAGLPKGVEVDLLLRRSQKQSVNVVLIESGLKPELRWLLRRHLGGEGCAFRAVFLSARLKSPADKPDLILLDTTQREFRLSSVYDLVPTEGGHGPGTLHFIDPAVGEWTTLRGLSLMHEPQVFSARARRMSTMDQLLWSEVHAEWVHEGETEAIKELRRAEDAKRRHAALEPVTARAIPVTFPPSRQAPSLPAWVLEGLVCVGCGQRTSEWQVAAPEKNSCVCRACFASGKRLP